MELYRVAQDASNAIQQSGFSSSFGALRIQILVWKHGMNELIQAP